MTIAPPPWKAQLDRDGFVVIKGVVPPERCADYADRALGWLEGFEGLGFKRDDPKTWDQDHMPMHGPGGLHTQYGVPHEDWVWECRTEDKVVDAFAGLWGTDELISSFDAINISLPLGPGKREDIQPVKPWPHMDQQPHPRGKDICEYELTQGQVALTHSGPTDGGLVLLRGSHALQKQHFLETGIKPDQDSGPRSYYIYKPDDVAWFKAHGCEELKVNVEAGDMILWDSRTIHWNCAPTGDLTRVVVYVCYYPAAMFTEEQLVRKKELFDQLRQTTHWPQKGVSHGGTPQRNGKDDPHHRAQPVKPPVFTERMKKLAGGAPY